MKKYLPAVILILLCTGVNNLLRAQDCEGFYPGKVGASMELTHYNEKGKIQSMTNLVIRSKEGSGEHIRFAVHSEGKDAKGKTIAENDYEAQCDHGTFLISMKNMISPDQLKAWEKMDVKMTADNVEIPTTPIPGQQLKDAHLVIDIAMSGMSLPGMKMDITDRKVESMETITTPAGSFDCLKISSNMHMKSIVPVDMRVVEWFSLGNGLIRSESYQGGKLKGYSLLTRLQK